MRVPTDPSKNSKKKFLVCIPARLSSQRLSRKPLQNLAGKPLIVRTYENVRSFPWFEETDIFVATDHQDIANVLEEKKIPYVMTSPSCESGSDRIFAASQTLIEKGLVSTPDFVINMQGDEPFLNAADMQNLCEKLVLRDDWDIATLVHARDLESNQDRWLNENVVKAVVSDVTKQALYFSRRPIPLSGYERNHVSGPNRFFWEHLGVYVFRQPFLGKFCALPRSPLELSERLEQLRALDNGYRILCAEAKHPTVGIDTPEDLEEATRMWTSRSSHSD